MGYYIRIDDVDWVVTESPEALATVREMPKKYHAIKRGGSSSGERWFSWMNDTDIENAESVESVFNQLGFETESTDGGFSIRGYDSKTGQEDLFLAVIAPFTKNGSYIEWIGEDDAHYRYEVREGRMFTMEAEIVWTHASPYAYVHYDWGIGMNESLHESFDPLADNSELLAVIENRNEVKQAHYEKLREERAKENAEA